MFEIDSFIEKTLKFIYYNSFSLIIEYKQILIKFIYEQFDYQRLISLLS